MWVLTLLLGVAIILFVGSWATREIEAHAKMGDRFGRILWGIVLGAALLALVYLFLGPGALETR